MKSSKIILITAVCLILQLLFCSCANQNTGTAASTTAKTTTAQFSSSYKEQMDTAFRHISNPKVLATINGVKITQVDIDLFSIGGSKHTVDDIIKYYVVADYGKKNSLKLDDWFQNLYDDAYTDMQNDTELTEEYCLNTYGIPKSEVIKYAQKRVYQLGMHSAFSSMVIEQVSSGKCPTLYPELKSAYNKFQKEKSKKGAKAWDDIEQAYYDMIAKDYDIVIYKK